MPDTILGGYSCPCGWKGNSRQALYWHKQNSCKLREQPEAQPEAPPKAAPALTVANVAPPEPSAVKPEKPQKVALVAVPDDDPEDDEPEGDEPEADEPDKEKDQFEVLLLPIIIIVLLVAGIIVFRERILAMFERMKGGQPPAYGVPDYVA